MDRYNSFDSQFLKLQKVLLLRLTQKIIYCTAAFLRRAPRPYTAELPLERPARLSGVPRRSLHRASRSHTAESTSARPARLNCVSRPKPLPLPCTARLHLTWPDRPRRATQPHGPCDHTHAVCPPASCYSAT